MRRELEIVEMASLYPDALLFAMCNVIIILYTYNYRQLKSGEIARIYTDTSSFMNFKVNRTQLWLVLFQAIHAL